MRDAKTGRMLKIPVTVERLKANCRVDEATGCWVWLGSKAGGHANGYGKLWSGKTISLHRTMWEVVNKMPVPKGFIIMHTCDNKPCCNPEHLLLGTYEMNNREAFTKGRNPCGERHNAAKLKAWEVLEIFKSSKRPTHIAKKYGVTRGAICSIKAGRSWSNVTGLRYAEID